MQTYKMIFWVVMIFAASPPGSPMHSKLHAMPSQQRQPDFNGWHSVRHANSAGSQYRQPRSTKAAALIGLGGFHFCAQPKNSCHYSRA